MRPRQQCFKALAILLALVIPLASAPAARATDAWENGRAYTKMLEDHAAAAAAAVAIAAAVAAAAAQDVVLAAAALARANTAATSAAALAALAAAEAAVASATATLVVLKTIAVAAAGAVAALALGTYIGQGLRGVWDWCWDPLCDATFSAVSIHPIPVDQFMFSTALVESTLATATSLATSGELSFSQADFDAAGIPTDFPVIGIQLFIGATRGAAAATAGNWAGVLTAAADLQPILVEYRAAVEAAADLIDATAFIDPTADFAAATADFETAKAEAISNCNAQIDDCVTMAAELEDASNSLATAQSTLATVDWATLANSPIFEPITLTEFRQFLLDTASLGAAALPPAEIDVADYLLEQAGVFYPGQPSQGPMIAAYDAQGDPNGNESLLFDPVTGELTLSELLRGSATTLSQNGAWLNIDLSQSELVQEANLALSAPVPVFSFPGRVALLSLLITATWVATIYRRRSRDSA